MVFGLYVVSIGVAIFRGVLAAPELDGSSDNDNDSDSDRNSSGNSNSRCPAPRRSDGHNESSSNENGFPIAEITSPSPYLRALRHSPRRLRTYVFQLIFGFLALSLSGYVLSHSAISITSELNISGIVYGIIILAFVIILLEKFIAVIRAL